MHGAPLFPRGRQQSLKVGTETPQLVSHHAVLPTVKSDLGSETIPRLLLTILLGIERYKESLQKINHSPGFTERYISYASLAELGLPSPDSLEWTIVARSFCRS